MKTLCKHLLLASLVFMLGIPVLSFADTEVVLDFEDFLGQYIPDGYGGIASWGIGTDWDYWSVIEGDDNYPAYSGTNCAYSFGLGVPIQFGAEYVFNGSWIGGPALPFEPVFYELYLAGVLVHTSEQTVITSDPIWIPSGYDGLVDEVRVWQLAGFALFTMDDFTYTTSEVATEKSTFGGVKALFR
jgi:hypothetical protein